MTKMPIDQFLAEIERCEPGLLGTKGVSHAVFGDRVHLLAKDIDGAEVWIYPNDDGTFTYERDRETERRDSVENVIEAVFGNEPGETRGQL